MDVGKTIQRPQILKFRAWFNKSKFDEVKKEDSNSITSDDDIILFEPVNFRKMNIRTLKNVHHFIYKISKRNYGQRRKSLKSKKNFKNFFQSKIIFLKFF